MAILPIIEVPDPRLRQISVPVETFDGDLKRLIADMFETMYDAPGIGLAAIQIGVAQRLLVIDLQEAGEGVRNPRVYVNPVFSDPSEEVSLYNEGCLSIPEQYAEVERPASVRVRWRDADGGHRDERVDGLLATCLQHENDHLEGVVFTDHLSRLKRDMVLKKLAKQRKMGKAA